MIQIFPHTLDNSIFGQLTQACIALKKSENDNDNKNDNNNNNDNNNVKIPIRIINE